MYISNVVFDTEALFSENFPEMSASFRKLIELAGKLNIRLYIPEIVIRELEQKFIDGTEKSINGINSEYQKLKKIVQQKIDLSIPNLEVLKEVYVTEVQNLIKNNKLIIIPIPPANIGALIDKAVKRVPPFEGKDKGFRDAMIIESIIEYGVNNKIKTFVFISLDKIFEHEIVAKNARSKGIELYLQKRIKDINEKIFELVDQKLQEVIKEREKRALIFLKTQEDEINKYLKTNFEISEYDIGDLSGLPLSMIEAKLVNIESAAIEDKEDNKKGISFEAEVNLKMLMQPPSGYRQPIIRTFKTGESEPIKSNHHYYVTESLNVSSLIKPVVVEKTIKVKGEIEVEQVEGEYKNFRIIYIHPQLQSQVVWETGYSGYSGQ